jgi:Tol biopolymer transport system component
MLLVGNYPGPLAAIAANGTSREVLPSTYAADGCFYLSPTWLPDNRRYLVIRWSQSGDAKAASCGGLFAGSIDSPSLSPVLAGGIEGVALVDDGLLFLRGGELTWQGFDREALQVTGQTTVLANDVVSFSAGAGTIAYVARSGIKPHRFAAGNRIALYPRSGGTPVFSGDPGLYGDPTLSPDGRSLLISDVGPDGRSRTVLVDVASGAPTPLGSAIYGVWSPDSARVALSSGGAHVLLMNLGDRSVRELKGPEGQRIAGVSHWQGSWLLGTVAGGLHAISTEEDARFVPVATAATGGRGSAGVLSFDQQWVAFEADRRIYVTPFPGPGQRRPVSSLAGSTPRWRGDGREIFFLTDAAGERAIVAVPVQVSGSSITFGSPQTLFTLRPMDRNWGFDVAPDGQRFLVVVEGEPDPATLTVMVGRR